MPNHTTNNVEIFGPKEDLQKIIDLFMAAGKDPLSDTYQEENGEFPDPFFSCHAIIPRPDFQGINSGCCTIDDKKYNYWRFIDGKNVGLEEDEIVELRAKHGAIGWYDWCVQHWDTKWGAYDHENWSKEPYPVGGDDGVLEYTFYSAWNPPTKVFATLTKQFPRVKVIAEAIDECGNFHLRETFEDGSCIKTEERTWSDVT